MEGDLLDIELKVEELGAMGLDLAESLKEVVDKQEVAEDVSGGEWGRLHINLLVYNDGVDLDNEYYIAYYYYWFWTSISLHPLILLVDIDGLNPLVVHHLHDQQVRVLPYLPHPLRQQGVVLEVRQGLQDLELILSLEGGHDIHIHSIEFLGVRGA